MRPADQRGEGRRCCTGGDYNVITKTLCIRIQNRSEPALSMKQHELDLYQPGPDGRAEFFIAEAALL